MIKYGCFFWSIYICASTLLIELLLGRTVTLNILFDFIYLKDNLIWLVLLASIIATFIIFNILKHKLKARLFPYWLLGFFIANLTIIFYIVLYAIFSPPAIWALEGAWGYLHGPVITLVYFYKLGIPVPFILASLIAGSFLYVKHQSIISIKE